MRLPRRCEELLWRHSLNRCGCCLQQPPVGRAASGRPLRCEPCHSSPQRLRGCRHTVELHGTGGQQATQPSGHP